MISTLLRENYFINLLRLPTCSTFSGQLWHTLRDESEKLFAPRTRAAEIISSHTAFVICSTERYRVITRPPKCSFTFSYAACRLSHPQRGQESKKLGIGTRYSPQSSSFSLVRFKCAYGSTPQCGQGSNSFPVLRRPPQQVHLVPAEYSPIISPPRNAVSSYIGKQSGIY